MCWLPIDEALPLPRDLMVCAQGPSPCSGTQSLASRLRRIGDEMDKNWTKATPVDASHCNGKTSNSVLEAYGCQSQLLDLEVGRGGAVLPAVQVLYDGRAAEWARSLTV
ncbi:hypothetical protein J4Q44_G00168490 [Coregonus suidteri]|uniref:Uncharacterized protein n=1 Tax=Coregonus suidteri TaxID=861788 RepID=A0AAN8LJY9_9TELE